MEPSLTIAVISAAVALGGAAVSVWGQFRVARLQRESEEKRASQRKEEEAESILARYRDPLLQAAFELQSRIFNILKLNFLPRFYLDPAEGGQKYAVENTLYVIAQYLGWTEIIRQEIQFLDLGDIAHTRKLSELQEGVIQLFLSSAVELGDAFRIFRGEQRAIGELMISPRNESSYCIGYAAFVEKLEKEDAVYGRWFDPLKADVDKLAHELDKHQPRLIKLQRALIDLIDFLDPKYVRFEKKYRHKIKAK